MSERIIAHKRTAVFTDLGLMEYGSALNRQLRSVASRMADPNGDDTIFFVEHPRVFTLGRRGGAENLVVSKDFLKQQGVDIVKTDRGGNITYHGPGQAVLYPIVDLKKNKIAVKEFVHGLEEIMKRTANDYGVSADRDERNHGLWVKNAKIGSVGISIKKGVSFHGLAMNIHNDLMPFSWINPCGLANVAMTSVANEVSNEWTSAMAEVKIKMVHHFANIFGFKVKTKTPHDTAHKEIAYEDHI